MENKKFVILLLALASFLVAQNVFAYGKDTHRYLTSEAADFYLLETKENNISAEFKNYLMDGVVAEDDAPRWLNHFFDPINGSGLTILGTEWVSAKEWSQNSDEQTVIGFKPLKSSFWEDVNGQEIEKSYLTSDFTWDEAIRYWVNGDKAMAMNVLGHILHLVQDMAVPDHTRNDQHMFGSVYEQYVLKYGVNSFDAGLSARLEDEKLAVFQDLDGYFDALAAYSNRYFYSADTVGLLSGYDLPVADPVNMEFVDGKRCIMSFDDRDNKYCLIVKRELNNYIAVLPNGYLFADDIVVDSYWKLLSTRAVAYSAGVIDLFFKDVEKMENGVDLNFGKAQASGGRISKLYNGVVSFFGGIGEYFAQRTGNLYEVSKNLFTFSVSENFEKVDEIGNDFDGGAADDDGTNKLSDATAQKSNSSKTISNKSETAALKKEVADLKKEIVELEKERLLALRKLEGQKENSDKISDEGLGGDLEGDRGDKLPVAKSAVFCSFGDTQRNAEKTVLINEVAWMGSALSSSDEWVELKNISGSEIDLSGWQLVDKDQDIEINFDDLKSTKVAAGGFILLERTDDSSALGVVADLLYGGSLSNSDEGLRLFDSNCNLVDEVLAGPKWMAGDNILKKTAERDSVNSGMDPVWHTSGVSGGTPKRENSSGAVSVVLANSLQATNPGGGGIIIVKKDDYPRIILNEIMLASASSTNDDFVEIYNPNDFDINLTGWYIQKKTKTADSFSTYAKADLFQDKIIKAHSYFIVANNSGSVFADIFTGNGLAINNSVVIKDPNGDIKDKVGWGEAGDCEGDCALSPQDGRSAQRVNFVDTNNNLNDFNVWCPTPGRINQECQGQDQPGNNPIEDGGLNEQGLDKIVISEIQVGGDRADNEFIELYNPNNKEVSLGGFSVQYLSGKATSTQAVAKKNFESQAKIAPFGYYLLVNGDADSGLFDMADMTYSFSLSGDSEGAYIFLTATTTPIVLFGDDLIIDQARYGYEELMTPEKNKSIERKAYATSTALTMARGGVDYYAGNGFDSNVGSDFVLSDNPNPQNSRSLPEPRVGIDFSDFSAVYDPDIMSLIFSFGQTGGLSYKISDVSDSGRSLPDIETDQKNVNILIDEVGRTYKFLVSQFDSDGVFMGSGQKEVVVPSFVDEVNFFRADYRLFYELKDNVNLVDFSFNEYPFLPDTALDKIVYPGGGANYKAIVFYLNQDAPKNLYLDNSHPVDPYLDKLLEVEYHTCAGSTGFDNSLVLPDNSLKCNINIGGFANRAARYPWYFADEDKTDNHLIFPVKGINGEIVFSESDYFTMAFYGYRRDFPQGTDKQWLEGGVWSNFQLLAVDRNRYYFKDGSHISDAPVLDGEISIVFDENNSKIDLSWPKAADGDSFDAYLSYEVKYSLEDEWETVYQNNAIKQVSEGGVYDIFVRARDDLGNYSNIVSVRWEYPVMGE